MTWPRLRITSPRSQGPRGRGPQARGQGSGVRGQGSAAKSRERRARQSQQHAALRLLQASQRHANQQPTRRQLAKRLRASQRPTQQAALQASQRRGCARQAKRSERTANRFTVFCSLFSVLCSFPTLVLPHIGTFRRLIRYLLSAIILASACVAHTIHANHTRRRGNTPSSPGVCCSIIPHNIAAWLVRKEAISGSVLTLDAPA